MAIFRFTSPTGTVVLTNPFVTNPDSPVKAGDFPKVDVILVADGHADEVGSADEIALKTGAKIVSTLEMARAYFEPRNVPVSQVLRSNPGDWNRIGGVTIRNVGSIHGSGTVDKMYGGAAMGFMIAFENGVTVYFAGSTALTLDMQLWGSLYKPDVAILPRSGGRDPQDIVHMVRLLRPQGVGPSRESPEPGATACLRTHEIGHEANRGRRRKRAGESRASASARPTPRSPGGSPPPVSRE